MAFGSPILVSVTSFFYGLTAQDVGTGREAFGNAHLLSVIHFELLTVPVVGAVLYVRGWRPKDFPVEITRLTTLLGVAAYAASWLLGKGLDLGLGTLFSSFRLALEVEYHPAHPPNLVIVYLVSLINPAFEEIIVCGYVMEALRKRFGDTAAINVSVVIRASYHLYQGTMALPFHLAYGLLQAYLYVRFRNLWPLIVSHALADFVPLAFFR